MFREPSGGSLELARDHQQFGHLCHPFTNQRKLE